MNRKGYPNYINRLTQQTLRTQGRFALDLGCGEGRAAIALAEMGYDVTAVDKDKESLNTLKERSGDLPISLVEADITTFNIQQDKYDIIVAHNVLPFIHEKDRVVEMVARMSAGLAPGGKMFFTLFGPLDAWAFDSEKQKRMSFFEYDEIIPACESLNVRVFFRSTEEGEGLTMKGNMKYWHVHQYFCIKK